MGSFWPKLDSRCCQLAYLQVTVLHLSLKIARQLAQATVYNGHDSFCRRHYVCLFHESQVQQGGITFWHLTWGVLLGGS